VIEIGAGLGSLTLALAETGAEVLAVEVDRGIVPVLRQVVAGKHNVTVIEADATIADWNQLLAASQRWTLVANLPYNVATPLVCDLLDGVRRSSRCWSWCGASGRAPRRSSGQTLRAERQGRIGRRRILGHVPASVFVPRPNVESALVRIDRRQPPNVDHEALFALVRTAFGQRRKMLRRSLAGSVDPAMFAAAGVSPEARPEQLAIDDWVRLTNATAAP
jgi:16S rRNA (adenine1518-N6/adenine1519-N6)-dimethyltransferase